MQFFHQLAGLASSVHKCGRIKRLVWALARLGTIYVLRGTWHDEVDKVVYCNHQIIKIYRSIEYFSSNLMSRILFDLSICLYRIN